MRFTRNVKLHLLSNVFLYAVVMLFSSQCDSLKAVNFRCKRVDYCACKFDNEDGYDLSGLSADKNGLNASIDNLTFYFHPCTDISIGNNTELNDCYEGVSVCLYNSTDKTYTNLGFSYEVSVTSEGLQGPVFFVYTHNSRVTTVRMEKCLNTSESTLKVGSSIGTHNNELLLHSPSACRRPIHSLNGSLEESQSYLSTGSVLVIILIVFSSLYFVGGALVLKFLRGAEGREMIPNYDFWVSLPGLVKEGFMFTLSGCRNAQAYDRI